MTHYAHARDIDPGDAIDAEEVDDLVARVVNPLALSFEHSADLGATFGALMADMLRQFLGTHQSIRMLMRSRGENPPAMADAMSLAREQIEKVYVVALLLEDPEHWTERYLKDEWRKAYERHLLEADERSGLARYDDFLKEQASGLENERKGLGISDEEKEFVEWRYRNPPGTTTPPHLKAASKTMANFPMPAEVIREVSDPQLKDALRRWQREYGYFSGYSHSGFRKLMPGFIEGNMKLTTAEKEKVVETEYAQSIMISYLAAGLACAEAASRALPRRGPTGPLTARAVGDADLLVRLSDLWDLLDRSSLVGRALYEMRARSILPPKIGAP
ncbi:hypothetical protein GBA63_19770 [Rubrobacter tropicus]|uniref:Uncharacterized protein n=1 Tax=Rubrobacter tropicus TaxID=2653851 RepID=A0A6G8QDT6_9ACTN|nr:hypothetical protein [Rubrobacter tropicus]QIN84639.1 hypothetical protein GBA63_19770 [Rubrobacter tropicus]